VKRLLVAVGCLFAQPLVAAPPNIVLIVADDLGYGDLGCYGSSLHRTVHIDGLARQGIRLTDYHTAGSMCTPTRASILTGQYPQRFGRDFEGPLSGVRHRDRGLPHRAVTIAEVLKERGYATAFFGKWHLGYRPPWLPPSQGFDEFRGLVAGDGDHHSHIDRWGNEDWWHNNRIAMKKGYTADLITEHSLDFIQRNRDQPFFLLVSHLAIHFPWQGPDDPPHRVAGINYRDDKWGIIPEPANVRPHVKAMVEAIDHSTGRILDAIGSSGLGKRTIVVFTSDNGGYLNYGGRFHNISSNGDFRGQKGTLYEGGHRVPMIVSWPGTIAPAVTTQTAHSNDLFPTFASLAGADVEHLSLDGVDLSPLLFEARPMQDRTLYWREGDDWCVRRGPWKLTVQNERTELFNLDHDVAEQKNVADANEQRVAVLTKAWREWAADVDRSAAKPH